MMVSKRTRNRPYVGVKFGVYTAFMSSLTPTEEAYPQYSFCIGPWHTLRDAQYWVENLAPFDAFLYNSLQYRRPKD